MAVNKNAKWQFHLTSLLGHPKVLEANQIAYSRPELAHNGWVHSGYMGYK